MAKSAISKIMKKNCRVIRVYLEQTFVHFPIATRFKVLACQEFEALHGNPHIIGIINGFHIRILASIIEGQHYFYQKIISFGFIIKHIVNMKCVFWDYNLGGQEICTIGCWKRLY